jgi:hypothetical protein
MKTISNMHKAYLFFKRAQQSAHLVTDNTCKVKLINIIKQCYDKGVIDESEVRSLSKNVNDTRSNDRYLAIDMINNLCKDVFCFDSAVDFNDLVINSLNINSDKLSDYEKCYNKFMSLDCINGFILKPRQSTFIVIDYIDSCESIIKDMDSTGESDFRFLSKLSEASDNLVTELIIPALDIIKGL